MANVDNPNGFTCVQGGFVIHFPVAASQTLAKGDAVALSSGQVTIATGTSGALLGVMAAPSASASANTLVPVYVGCDQNVFEGQCSGDSAISLIGTSVDIEGTTGVMEVNEDATTEQVIRIVELDPNSEIGTNGRVRFVINRSQYNGYTAAL